MKKLYAIFDRAAEAIGPVMVFAHDAAAIRSFGDVASDPQSLISRHPADFELLHIGEVTDRGVVDTDGPRVVITGEQWKMAQQPAEVAD
jgi:hypothetical protein